MTEPSTGHRFDEAVKATAAFGRVETRLEAVEKGLDSQNAKLDRLIASVDNLTLDAERRKGQEAANAKWTTAVAGAASFIVTLLVNVVVRMFTGGSSHS